MLELKNINKSFGSLQVLDNVSATFGRGEVVSIVGPSGAGKTTLLQIAGTLDKPDSGSVVYDGVDVSAMPERKLSEFRNKRIGFVFQFHQLLPEFTALENVAIPALIHGESRSKAQARAKDLLEMLGLASRADHKPMELSGGEKQRVAVARALVHNPKLVIADEPTGNIDPELSQEMMQLLERVSKMGITVLVVTHEHELVHRFHQRVVTLSHGRIVSDVPADPVAAAEDDLSLDVAAFDADDASAAKKEVAAV